MTELQLGQPVRHIGEFAFLGELIIDGVMQKVGHFTYVLTRKGNRSYHLRADLLEAV